MPGRAGTGVLGPRVEPMGNMRTHIAIAVRSLRWIEAIKVQAFWLTRLLLERRGDAHGLTGVYSEAKHMVQRIAKTAFDR
jgi:hypothetical protein